MRGRSIGALIAAQKPVEEGQGNVEVECTTVGIFLRLHVPATGTIAEVTLDAEHAITTAAQLLTSAIRLSDRSGEEVAVAFEEEMKLCVHEITRQQSAGRPS